MKGFWLRILKGNYSILRIGLAGAMAVRVVEFSIGGTKLENKLPKNQHTQRKLLNFENWVNGEVSKSAKSPNLLTFKVNFLYLKLSETFSIFLTTCPPLLVNVVCERPLTKMTPNF